MISADNTGVLTSQPDYSNDATIVEPTDNQAEESKEPTELERELIAFVTDHTDRWRDYRDQNFMADWEKYERIFRGVWSATDKQRESERSRIISPATQQAIETRHAEIMEAIFGQGEFFDIEADLKGPQTGPQTAEQMKTLLNEDFKKDKIIKSIDQIELMAEIFGTGIGEIIVGEEKTYTPHTMQIDQNQAAYGVKEGSRVTVKINPVNPKNFLFDPNGTSIDDCMGVAVERYVSIHKIKAGIKSGIYNDVDISEEYKDNSLEPTQEDRDFQDQKVLLLTYYGLVPTEYLAVDANVVELFPEDDSRETDDYDDMTEAIVIIANGKLLKGQKTPYMMEDRPIVSYQDDTVPNRLLGRGTAEKALNMQVAIDSQMRSHLDSLALTTAPMVGMDATRLPRGSKFEVKPGKSFLTNGNPAEILMPFHFGTNDGQAMQTSKEFERMLLMATSTLDSQGMITPGSRDAGGLAPAVAGIIKKYKRALVNFQEDFLIPFINKASWRRMQYDPERYQSVSVKFVPTATLGIIAREYEQQQIAFLIQTLGGNSPLTPVLMKGILKNSSLSTREAMIDELDQMSKPNPQQQQIEQQKEMMSMKLLEAQAAELTSKAQKNTAEAQSAPVLASAQVQKIDKEIQLEAAKSHDNLAQELARSTNDATLQKQQTDAEMQLRAEIEAFKHKRETDALDIEKYKIDQDNETKLKIAGMSAATDIVHYDPQGNPIPSPAITALMQAVSSGMAQLSDSHMESSQLLAAAQAELSRVLSKKKVATLSNGRQVSIE